LSRGNENKFNVNIDFTLPADFISEEEMGLIHLHLGDLIQKTFNSNREH